MGNPELSERQIQIIREARRIDRLVDEAIATGLATEQDQQELNTWANIFKLASIDDPLFAQAITDKLTAISDEIKQSGAPEPIEIFNPDQQ